MIDASATDYGFDAHRAANVVFENLVITGARTPGRSVCATCGRGIWGGDAMKVFNVQVSGNAQDGIGGGNQVTRGWLIVGSQLVGNGSAGQGFAAAGVKSSKFYTLLNSYVANNMGVGAWCDVGCSGGTWTVVGNTVVNNAGGGIRYEISDAGALIKNNVVRGNNTSKQKGAAGIELVSAGNAVVEHNTVEGNSGVPVRISAGLNRRRNAFGPSQILDNLTNGQPVVGCTLTGLVCFANH